MAAIRRLRATMAGSSISQWTVAPSDVRISSRTWFRFESYTIDGSNTLPLACIRYSHSAAVNNCLKSEICGSAHNSLPAGTETGLPSPPSSIASISSSALSLAGLVRASARRRDIASPQSGFPATPLASRFVR